MSPSTIYATFVSRDGILRALMERTLFAPHYAAAKARLDGETDPVKLIVRTAGVARAIYDGESPQVTRPANACRRFMWRGWLAAANTACPRS